MNDSLSVRRSQNSSVSSLEREEVDKSFPDPHHSSLHVCTSQPGNSTYCRKKSQFVTIRRSTRGSRGGTAPHSTSLRCTPDNDILIKNHLIHSHKRHLHLMTIINHIILHLLTEYLPLKAYLLIY